MMTGDMAENTDGPLRRNVVIVAPHFPPSNLAAVHRSRLFALHLPKFGWNVTILSVRPCYYEERLDPELAALVPDWLRVYRTPALRTRPLRLFGDIGLRSLWWHYRALRHLTSTRRVDLVYIPIPPNYSALLGPLIKRQMGVPYAIDFIDPWVHTWPGCEVRFSKAWTSYQLSKVLEPIALRWSALVTGVAPAYYEGALRRYSWLDPERCVAMPYGAEATDFKPLYDRPRPPWLFDPDDGNLHVVYAGAMLPRAYSTLVALLQAVRWAGDAYRDEGARLRLHFIGTGSNKREADDRTVQPWADRYGLSEIVREHPRRMAYLDVLNHLKHAHAVLVMGSSEAHYTASKVFQAVLSKRPVFGLLHAQSSATSILRTANAGPVVTFDSDHPATHQIERIGRALLEAARGQAYTPETVNWKAFESYSAEQMARQLAQAFDSVVEADGSLVAHEAHAFHATSSLVS
jgi:hypothetical protein